MIEGDGTVIFWNAAAETMFGFSISEAVGEKIDKLIVPEDFWSAHVEKLEIFARTGEGAVIGKSVSLIGQKKDGTLFPIDLTLSGIKNELNSWQAVGIVHDATMRKKNEDALRKSREHLTRVVETIVEGIYIVDAGGHIVFANKAAEKMFGITKDELYSRSYDDAKWDVRKADGSKLYKKDFPFSIVKSTKKPVFGIELLTTHPDGTKLIVSINAAPMFDNGGAFDGMVATQQDITDKKRKEQELKAAHRENEALLGAMKSILIRTSAEGTITRTNSTAIETFGFDRSRIIGKKIYEIEVGWDNREVRRLMKKCADSKKTVSSDDMKFKGVDGGERFVGFSVNPVFNEESILNGFLFLGSDLTERRILESQLTQSQKLESIGSLAAGIAHEINTPTQFTGDNIHFLKDSFGDILEVVGKYRNLVAKCGATSTFADKISKIKKFEEELDIEYLIEEIPEAIESALSGTSRVSNIVKAMKDYSHPPTSEKVLVDLNRVIDSVITISRNEWKYVAELETNFSDEIGMVPCFPDEFNQVILNLITNAAHAISEKLGESSEEKGLITVSTTREDEWAVITVSDTGSGIPDSIKGKVFDHFFTTKEVGRGTGQGLSISRNIIIEKHGGQITFDSTEGEGTSFVIKLPLEHF
jgi:PAS domain S-box-containing protein